MESNSQVNVPLRAGAKKMRKRRELDALVAHSMAKRGNKRTNICGNGSGGGNVGNGINSQDQLLSPSTDEQEDFGWPKIIRNSNRSRNHHRKGSFFHICGPIIFLMCISISLGFMYWLYFDLRQQLYEYRQKVEEVTATNQNLPEELQKWHETSKNLQQNQTIIYNRINDIQLKLENLTINLNNYKNQYENTKLDYDKGGQFVADFGAKIAAITLDMEHIKDKFTELQQNSKNFNNNLSDIENKFNKILNITNISTNSNNIGNLSDKINNINDYVENELKMITTNLSAVNYTLSQRVNGIENDLLSHNKQLEALNESSALTKSQVQSIESDWTQYKNKTVTIDDTLKSMATELNNLRNSTNYMVDTVKEIRATCKNCNKEIPVKERIIQEETTQIPLTIIGNGNTENLISSLSKSLAFDEAKLKKNNNNSTKSLYP